MTTSFEVTTRGSSQRRQLLALVLSALVLSTTIAGGPLVAPAHTTETLALRGHPQLLRLYGARASHEVPVIVSSGDGGWIHLAPHVAETLSARGFFVVGFDVRAYLESFTSATTTLSPAAEPEDYRTLATFAAQGSAMRPILIGVSEGAGLSLLAASDARTKASISGVIAIGLPAMNELGWRWWDAMIYVTHGVPNEPTFRTAAIVGAVAPVPLAAIHSTHDEFVSVGEVERVLQAANEPKHLWTVGAVDHRFSDHLPEFDQRLFDAIAWTTEHQPR